MTGVILKLYCDTIGDQVTKDDSSYYVYGLLYDPAYRTKYAAGPQEDAPAHPNTGDPRNASISSPAPAGN
ncbi:type ISP restriction/modification enzyme [Mycobacterium tuberculosis]